MPQHSIQQRTKKAKREGTLLMAKGTDLGGPVQGSAHAAKKSSHVVGPRALEERSLGLKAPPSARSTEHRSSDEARAAYRAENAASGGGRGRPFKASEPHPRPKTRVQGRKKAPSRMNIKQKGGPKKVSRLRGGGKSARG
jgi:hypothetical protein